MATTIKLKNGSGAPTAGDLVQGEPALDLTNKRLYTEDAGGNVIEVGTSPSTIDINAGSIDGVTLGTNSAVTSAVITTADINGGSIDGVTLGTNSAITALTVNGNVSVDGGTIKLDGNYPVGANNVALGNVALSSGSLSGDENTAIGSNALASNTSGRRNTAVGEFAAQSNQDGQFNVAIGRQALEGNVSGDANIAIGQNAMLVATASNNVGVGNGALLASTTGAQNVAIGYAALEDSTTGIYNTAIGFRSGDSITTGSKNTILGGYNGNQNGLDIRTSNNYIVLSDGDGTPFAYGQVVTGASSNNKFVFGGYSNVLTTGYAETVAIGDSLNSNGYALAIESKSIAVRFGHKLDQTTFDAVVGSITLTGSATAYNTSSDYRLKENVIEIPDAVDRLKQLKPSRFNFIKDPDTVVDGFLAHEVQDIVPEAITGEKDAVDDEGNPEYQSIDQSKLVPLLTAALKEAITEIESLKERVATLESN